MVVKCSNNNCPAICDHGNLHEYNATTGCGWPCLMKEGGKPVKHKCIACPQDEEAFSRNIPLKRTIAPEYLRRLLP